VTELVTIEIKAATRLSSIVLADVVGRYFGVILSLTLGLGTV